MDLTPRQKSVLQFIEKHQKQFNMAPSVREICSHFNLKSPGGIHRILNVLIDKGYLSNQPGKKRAWRVNELSQTIPHSIPLLGNITAGVPITAIENLETLPISAEFFGSDDCFALRVQGDSMVEAHILPGDIAIIRRQTSVGKGQIAAVLIEDIEPLATLKIFNKKRHSIELHPANKNYEPLIFKGEEQGKVSILGKYIGIVRKG